MRIAFQCAGLGTVLVKRIVAYFGDTVQIKDGVLFVNRTRSSIYGQDAVFEDAGITEEEIVLEEGKYFVIGDNVTMSKDSRYEEVGVVKEKDIIGKVIIP